MAGDEWFGSSASQRLYRLGLNEHLLNRNANGSNQPGSWRCMAGVGMYGFCLFSDLWFYLKAVGGVLVPQHSRAVLLDLEQLPHCVN